jgi:hypothetical protein
MNPAKTAPAKGQKKRKPAWIKVNCAGWKVQEMAALAECQGIPLRLFLEHGLFGALQKAATDTGIEASQAVQMTKAQRRQFAVQFREHALKEPSFELRKNRGSTSSLFLPLSPQEASALTCVARTIKEPNYSKRGALGALIILQTALLHWKAFRNWIEGDEKYAQREGFLEAEQGMGVYRTKTIGRQFPPTTAPVVSGGAQ